MRVLVFSDSHGRWQPMVDAVEVYRPDVIFHLGDVVRDGEKLRRAYPDLPFYQVQGNCDMGWYDCPEEAVARLEGKSVFYLHGHTRQVKYGVHNAVEAAKAVGADILLFGHTHSPLCDFYGDLLAVNPGAMLNGCCALLTWERGEAVTCIPISR